MIAIFGAVVEIVALFVAAIAVSWALRRVIRALTRQAMRRAQVRPGTWRGRLRRRSDSDADIETRKRQRADAAARMLGHIVTAVLLVTTCFIAMQIVGVDPVFVISSAGFVGLAIALSGQEIIRNLLSGTMALLEDRYAVGDHVLISAAGKDVRGTIDLMGPASVRLRTEEGATWHAGHATIDCVTNYSQLAASAEITIPTDRWTAVEEDASKRLATASNDIGLTGVIFLPELASQQHPAGVTTVTVRSNRPLTDGQRDLVHERLTTTDT